MEKTKGTVSVPAKKRTRKNVCKVCYYWDSPEDSPIGICHRNPPVVGRIVPNQQGNKTPECYFPLSGEGSWCGEFRPKKRKA